MNRSEDVIFNQTFRDDDSVFIVRTTPRHEGNTKVASKSQVSVFNTRTIGHWITLFKDVTGVYDWNLVKVSFVVGTDELGKSEGDCLLAVLWHEFNTRRIYKLNSSIFWSGNYPSRTNSCIVFHTSSNDWNLRFYKRNGLTLHVGSHQSTFGVIVFDEWDQGSGNTQNLLRRNVGVASTTNRNLSWFTGLTSRNLFGKHVTTIIYWNVSLSDSEVFF